MAHYSNEPSGGSLFVAGIVFGALIAAVPSCIHVGTARSDWEKEAIKAGVAEYYLDENASRQFRYLPGNAIKEKAPQ